MANYFSSAPIDLGGNILSRAYSDANQAIIQGLGMYGKRKESELERAQQLKMQKLEADARAKAAQDAAIREFQTYNVRNAAEQGINPVFNADGTIDPVATGARVKAAREAAALAQRGSMVKQDRDLQLGFQAEELGLNQQPAASMFGAQPGPAKPAGGINQFASDTIRNKLNGNEVAGNAAIAGSPYSGRPNLARDIAVRKSEVEAEKYRREREMTADAQIRANSEKESMAVKAIKDEMVADGIDINTPAGKDEYAFRLKVNRLPNDAKYAALTTREAVASGLIPNNPAAIRREEARLLPFNGKTPTLTPAMEKSVLDESNLVMNLSSVQKAISAFEQKYGPGSFDRYVGPIDNRTNEWKLQISKEAASPADEDAKRIAQLFQTTFNADLKATSGGAVTESEAVRKIREAGSLDGASFKNSLQGWREARTMGLKNKQKVLGSYAVPPGLFNYGEDDAGPAPGAPAPAGFDDAKMQRLQELRNKAGLSPQR